MTAKEMFEKLGYEKLEPNEAISYVKDGGYFNFWKNTEKITQLSLHETTMEELQAINQQCKELGWL